LPWFFASWLDTESTGFRIQADLKKKLLKLAKQEARSLSQICEMLLKIGVDEYDKEGLKYLQKILITMREEDQR